MRDEPINPLWDGVKPYREHDHIYTHNVEGIHEFVRSMRRVFDSMIFIIALLVILLKILDFQFPIFYMDMRYLNIFLKSLQSMSIK